jgi:5-formyltetrahydrofolate cyclo-ligase
MTKKQYRQKMLTLRSGLAQDRMEEKSSRIIQRFISLEGLMEFRDYLAYVPIRNEVDTSPLITRLMNVDKRVYAPRCDPQCEGRMDFFLIRDFSELKPGYQGIDEPCPDSSRVFVNHDRAVCILPGLAFDRSGYRLGYGLGFFDRYLKKLSGPAPLLVGLAYDFQVVETLPGDEWDVPVDIVVAEHEVIFAGSADISRETPGPE